MMVLYPFETTLFMVFLFSHVWMTVSLSSLVPKLFQTSSQ